MSEHAPSRRRRGRPTPPIVLSDTERETLARWAKRRRSSQALALYLEPISNSDPHG